MNSKENISRFDVSVYQNNDIIYPGNPPYSPNTGFPEYHLNDLSKTSNKAYEAVRNALHLLKLDIDNYNAPKWNPLKDIVKPGDTVVIKPNFVIDRHYDGGDIFSIITHPSVIRAVIDYIYIALEGQGKIIIADSPQMDCNFDNLLQVTNLKSIQELYEKEFNFKIDIYDLRDFWLENKGETGISYNKNRNSLKGDPEGNLLVNLGKKSLFYEAKNHEKFYGSDYNRKETIKHHKGDVQEYLLSKTILSADVVISIPKLKTHKKVGVTLNTKGLVGMNVNKNYLVHYRIGTPLEGGDEFPDNTFDSKELVAKKLDRLASDKFLALGNIFGDRLYDISLKFGKKILRPMGFKFKEKEGPEICCGDWYGNDSAWRMAVDLLKVFIYADENGDLKDHPTRRMFSIVDGITAGERNGPLNPESKNCGVIAAGFNLPATDIVCARLMGFDITKINILKYIMDHCEEFIIDPQSIKIFSNAKLDNLLDKPNKGYYLNFIPPEGWKGYLEIKED